MTPWGELMFCLKKCRKAVEEQMEDAETTSGSSAALRAVGWTSVALAVTALGLYVGRELRLRYKIRHRTPSDLFSHAGEDFSNDLNAEFGMGI